MIQVTFSVTDEQFERLDSIGIFNQAGILFQSCRVVVASGDGHPIKEKISEELLAMLNEHKSDNRGVNA